MKMHTVFHENRDKWVEQWLDFVIGTYPAESGRFFRNTLDPFSNPVGVTLKKGIEDLYDILVAPSFDPDAVAQAVKPMVHLRAVQEFTASESLGFLFEIKKIAAAGVKKLQIGHKDIGESMAEFESRDDAVMLIAFDLYMASKRKVYELRSRHARDNVRQLLIKKGLICELPDIDPDLGDKV